MAEHWLLQALPPLPAPHTLVEPEHTALYTDLQMKEYAEQAILTWFRSYVKDQESGRTQTHTGL